MKVGLVLECGPEGPDKKVCCLAVKLLAPGAALAEPRTLDNKRKLLTECGDAANLLLTQERCDRVLIVWDLYPNWRGKHEKPDCVKDRQLALDSLRNVGLEADRRVSLVCITEELEAWLLADRAAVLKVIHRYHGHRDKTRKLRTPRDPARTRNPKKALGKLFNEFARVPYSDRDHAEHIFRSMTDLSNVGRVPSFARFASKLLGKAWPT